MDRATNEKYMEIIRALRGDSDVIDRDMAIQILEDSIDDVYLDAPLRDTFDAIASQL